MSVAAKLQGKTTRLASAPAVEVLADAPDPTPAVEAGRFMWIETHLIEPNPWQPRRHFDQAKIESLAESIREHGVLSPLTVSFLGQRVILVAGERRLKASRIAEHGRVPCVVTDKDPEVLALVENMQREDLAPMEEAEAYARLQRAKGYDLAGLAKLTGKAQSTISEIMSLAKLPEPVKEAARKAPSVRRRALVEIAKIREPSNAIELLGRVESGELTSDGLKELRKRMQPAIPKPREPKPGAGKPAPATAPKGRDTRAEAEKQAERAASLALDLAVILQPLEVGKLRAGPRGELSKRLRYLAQAMDPVFLGLKRLKVQGEKEAELLDKALRRALHGFEGAELRWEKRRRHGISDASLVVAMSEEFGTGGGGGGPGCPLYRTKGGQHPEFRAELPSGEIKLAGKALVAKVRELMELPLPARERGGK